MRLDPAPSHSGSKLKLLNLSVEQFSLTVRTTESGTPLGTRTWMSSVISARASSSAVKC